MIKKMALSLLKIIGLNIFDKLDLSGPSRAFFSNLQLQKVEKNKAFL